jgi:hypothetical protein
MSMVQSALTIDSFARRFSQLAFEVHLLWPRLIALMLGGTERQNVKSRMALQERAGQWYADERIAPPDRDSA